MSDATWGPDPKRIKMDTTKSDANEMVTRSLNHIYFYDGTTTKNLLKFNRLVDEIDNEQQTLYMIGNISEATIHIHINSGGGSLLNGFSMASKLLSAKSKTIGYAEGWVASAATLPLIVCKERKMQSFSYVLIHQLSTINCGTYEMFKDNQDNLDKFMNMLVKIYTKYTKITEEKIREIMKHDLVMDIDECTVLGIVDRVY